MYIVAAEMVCPTQLTTSFGDVPTQTYSKQRRHQRFRSARVHRPDVHVHIQPRRELQHLAVLVRDRIIDRRHSSLSPTQNMARKYATVSSRTY